MLFLEKDLEDLIYRTLQKPGGLELLMARGFPIQLQHRDGKFYLFRQFSLGNYGTLDLLMTKIFFNDHPQPSKYMAASIYELKKEPFKKENLIQICRYMSGLQQLGKHIGLDIYVNAYLIFSKTDLSSDDCYLLDLNHNESSLGFYNFDLSVEKGLVFTEDIGRYYLPAHGFNKDFEEQHPVFIKGLEKEISAKPILELESKEDSAENPLETHA